MLSKNDSKVIVIVPIELDVKMRNLLESKLAILFNGERHGIEYKVEPDMLAGLKVYFGSKVIDLSLDSYLDSLV